MRTGMRTTEHTCRGPNVARGKVQLSSSYFHIHILPPVQNGHQQLHATVACQPVQLQVIEIRSVHSRAGEVTFLIREVKL